MGNNEKRTFPIRDKPIKKSRNKVLVKCDTCGIKFEKLKCEVNKHNFCCFRHVIAWNRKRLSVFNRTKNKMNTSTGWTKEMRMKKRLEVLSKCKNEDKTYKKYLGRHIHRIIAEKMLGRKLKKGEVVHHIDGNKTNNNPSNLMVFSSQGEHARFHMKKMKGKKHG